MLDVTQRDKEIFYDKVKNAHSIAILGHIHPDGDCVGSCMGLYNYILDNDASKEVTVYLQNLPESFGFLRYSDRIVFSPDDKIYDLAISLDCGDRDRHGDFADIFGNAKNSICIDHHKSNIGFGDYFYCDPDASSTAELVYRFMDVDKITRECAECIYLGIIHDTGVFKYPSTGRSTMECAGILIDKGVNSQFIIDSTFYQVSYNRNKLKAQAVLDSKIYLDGKLIATCVTEDIFKKYDTSTKDTDGIVDQIRLTKGIEVAVFAYQVSENTYKYSLRSIELVDVSLIAVGFGGGGHARAAGFTLTGAYEDNLELIMGLVEKQLQEHIH